MTGNLEFVLLHPLRVAGDVSDLRRVQCQCRAPMHRQGRERHSLRWRCSASAETQERSDAERRGLQASRSFMARLRSPGSVSRQPEVRILLPHLHLKPCKRARRPCAVNAVSHDVAWRTGRWTPCKSRCCGVCHCSCCRTRSTFSFRASQRQHPALLRWPALAWSRPLQLLCQRLRLERRLCRGYRVKLSYRRPPKR